MKMLYEVKAELVHYDTGRHAGYEHIAYTLNEAKAEEIRENFRKELKARDKEWYLEYGTALSGEPRVVIDELGEITE